MKNKNKETILRLIANSIGQLEMMFGPSKDTLIYELTILPLREAYNYICGEELVVKPKIIKTKRKAS